MIITGGISLKGDVTVCGSKNAAVAILPAVLLSDTPCTIENVPNILDVKLMLDILEKLGSKCVWLDRTTVRIDSGNVTSFEATFDVVSKLRGSYYFMGALLGRFGRALVSLPGGCNLGTRPIDQHLKGFQALNADVKEEYGRVYAKATSKDENGKYKLIGNNIYLDVVSVGATINLILAGCKASGSTVIENCAREPHVVDVANFLNALGAKIRGAGTDTIKITGVDKLGGDISYSVIPDQIEAGTFMIAAAATKGDVTVHGIIPKHMESLSAKLQEMNVGVEEHADSIRVHYISEMNPVNVKTLPYPGFPTDLQPQITVLLSMAQGNSNVTESVSDLRFQYIDELKRMGADIKLVGKTAMITGGRKLRGLAIACPDLRAGAALTIAGLAAEGVTKIHGVQYIDRGYAHFDEKLISLGANVRREDSESNL